MPDYDPAAFATALPDDAPCGPDLEYDAEFLVMQKAGEGRAEAQYGDTVIPGVEPDWPTVQRQAMQLAERTRDLRVATWLARSGARVDGLPGAVRGLQLAHALVDAHWNDVHPRLDEADGNDPTARVSALMPLVAESAGLADLRAATLTGGRNAIAVRQIELAAGAEPIAGEAVPGEASVRDGVRAALAESPAVGQQMEAGFAAASGIAGVLERHLEASQTPDFNGLKKLLQRVAEAGRKAAGRDAGTPSQADGAPPAASAARAGGAIASREDASRMLDRVCEWIEKNEPSQPAPLLIRRAQRLLSKNFLEIIKDVAPDGLGQIEKLAGTAHT